MPNKKNVWQDKKDNIISIGILLSAIYSFFSVYILLDLDKGSKAGYLLGSFVFGFILFSGCTFAYYSFRSNNKERE